jgi:signal transduction protein with GAF and PtsI domain
VTNEDQVNKGRKAKQLLEDETLNAAIGKLENDQLWIFRSSKSQESVKRETAWCMLQAIEGLRQELTKVMDNGKIAQSAITKSQKNLI